MTSDGAAEPTPSTRIWTWPNALSAIRLLGVPLFLWLVIGPEADVLALVVLMVSGFTDWLDGYLARRLDQMSKLGEILDPVADRLAIGAGLLTFAISGIFPFWAALLILVRDVAVLLGGAAVLWGRDIRIEVRWIGKIATFSLMVAIAWIAWGNAGGPLGELLLVGGWLAYVVGIVEYYIAAGLYAIDIRDRLAERGMVEK